MYKQPVKRAINELCALVGGPVVVIDSPLLRSVKCLREFGVEHVDVINFEKLTAKSASSRTMVTFHAGVSTKVLKKLGKKKKAFYKVAYLDYCGTPTANRSTGCDPMQDFQYMFNMLRDDGLVIATFSKRGVKDTHLIARKKMKTAGFIVLGHYSYFSKTAMLVVMGVKRKFAAKRHAKLWKAVSKLHGLHGFSGDYTGALIEYDWCKGEKYVGRVLRSHPKHPKYWSIQWEHRVASADQTTDLVRLDDTSPFRVLS